MGNCSIKSDTEIFNPFSEKNKHLKEKKDKKKKIEENSVAIMPQT